jgi:CHAT domain-containing protein
MRAKALQQTMNWMIDTGALTDPETGKVVFSYAHPIFWAPFALVGDGG